MRELTLIVDSVSALACDACQSGLHPGVNPRCQIAVSQTRRLSLLLTLAVHTGHRAICQQLLNMAGPQKVIARSTKDAMRSD